MSNPENRKRPHILHASPEVNALVRAFAAKRGITPNDAAEQLIQGTTKDIVDAAASIARLTRELTIAEENAAAATRLATRREKERDALRAELASARAAHKIVAERAPEIRSAAPALPRDLEKRVKACIAARPHARPPRDFAFVVKNGCDRIEASDRYQNAQKAAKRAEEA